MTRKVVDWEAVELQYRAGIRSLKDIGSEFGVSDAGIIKRAKRDGWSRDLKAKIQAKAEAKVREAAVSAEVSAQTKVREQAVVEANAEAVFRVRMSHRTDIAETRELFRAMLAELRVATTPEGNDLIEQMFEVVHGGEDEEDSKRAFRMRQLLDKALSLAGRVDTGKKLAEMLEKLIRLEREAWGIAGEPEGKSAVDDLLIKLGRGEL